MKTRQVRCGDVLIGGGAPVSVQSMTNVDSRDEKALLRQIEELQEAGCQIVRIAVFDNEAAAVLASVRKKVKVPLWPIFILTTGWLWPPSERSGQDQDQSRQYRRARARQGRGRKRPAERQIPIRVGVNSARWKKICWKNTAASRPRALPKALCAI